MIREEITFLGCGFNKAKYAGKMKYCIEHGLDFGIYKLGPKRIKKMIQRKFLSIYFQHVWPRIFTVGRNFCRIH
jgi:hypothetical protein